jgi:hypothetical protein
MNSRLIFFHFFPAGKNFVNLMAQSSNHFVDDLSVLMDVLGDM